MTAHDVYVVRDAAGCVLYVGCTGNLLQRLAFHGHSKSWWDEVATVTVEHFPDRGSALERETALIEELNPPYGGRARSCWQCGRTATHYYYRANNACMQVCDEHPEDGARPILPRQREGLPDGDPRHGTRNGYDNHTCRCAECCAANTAYQRARREKASAVTARDRRFKLPRDGRVIEEMRALYREGLTLEEVGERFGVTRERVRQLIPDEPARRRRERAERRERERARRQAEIDARRLEKRRHGTVNRYQNYGCRCDECRAANVARVMEGKKRRVEAFRAGEVDPPHGSASTYANYGCRCRPCTDAWSARCHEYKLRRASA